MAGALRALSCRVTGLGLLNVSRFSGEPSSEARCLVRCNRELASPPDRVAIGLVDDVRAHRVFGTTKDRPPFVTKLVLEDGNHALSGGHGAVKLFLEDGLPTFEVVVEIRQDRVKRNLAIVGPIPVVHVGFETLPRAIAIESETIIERSESKRSHPFGKVRSQAAEQFGGYVWVIPNDAVLISIEWVVGGERRR